VVVVGALDGGAVGVTALEGGAVDVTAVEDGSVGVVGVSASSLPNAKMTRSSTATAMTAQITITATRGQPDHRPSKSPPPREGGTPAPPPPAGAPMYVCVGSPMSDGYATGRSLGTIGPVGPSGGPGGGVDMPLRSLRLTPGRSARLCAVRLWVLRVVWLALPLAAGAAASDALDGWPEAPRLLGAAFLWLAWGAGLLALLAPRPVGLTALRIVAPTFAVLALVAAAAGDASVAATSVCVAITVAAAALVADPAFAVAAVNGVAYGDERRHPLRTPPGLYFAPVPLARAVVAVGITAGPLLLADDQIVAGIVALVIGWPAAAFAARALHALARRWMVLVPAGVVVVDPMTIADPVLFVRQHVRSMRAVDPAVPIVANALDLRLGASWGSLVLDLDGAADLVRVSRRGGTGETVRPETIVVAVAAREALLAEASQRRVRVELA
jgi:hypothetical protein